MKRTCLLVVFAALVIGSLVYGQVYSRNAVGYTKVTCERGQLYMLQTDFFQLGGLKPTASNLFGTTSLPVGTRLLMWETNKLGYQLEELSSNMFFSPPVYWAPGTNLFLPGKGFWLRIPTNAINPTYDVYLMGEVPDRLTQPTGVVGVAGGPARIQGLNQIGFPFPTETLWTNTDLAKKAGVGDALWEWVPAQTNYKLNVLNSNMFFVPPLYWSNPTQILQVGRAYWYIRHTNNPTAIAWTEIKPYTWP